MNCKFCGAPMENEDKICPACGRSIEDTLPAEAADENQPVAEETEAAAETAEEAAETEKAADETAEAEEVSEEADGEKTETQTEDTAEYSQPEAESGKPSKPAKKKKGVVVALSILCVALDVALCAAIFYVVNGGWKIRHNDLYFKDNYTVGAAEVQDKADKVVATMGDYTLTNGQLQLYYWMQVYDYLDYWGNYLPYFGLNPSIPMNQQIQDEETGTTWEQYFLDIALRTWQRYQVLNIKADGENFELSDEFKEMLDGAKVNMVSLAEQNGFSSADALVQSEMGPGCDMDDYTSYLERYYRGYQYFEKEYNKLSTTPEEVAKYFDDHIGDFEEIGVTKDSGLVSNVRHILIAPEGEGTDEDGRAVFTDEEWAACEAKAQALLDEWKAGEATEESFIAMVADNTADGGSAANGGLYENVAFNSNFVEPFQDWATNPDRKPGDCELVKSEFGYHLMYFVSGQDAWSMYAESSLMTEKSNQMVEGFIAEYPMKVNFKDIVLGEVSLAPKQ